MAVEEHGQADEVVDAGERPPAQDSKRVAIFVIVGIVIVAIGLVVLVNTGQQQDPTVAPEGWQVPDVAEPQHIELDDGDNAATVVINADAETCWNAYLGPKAVDGCGPAVFRVTGAAAAFGANASSTESERLFLGMAIWNGEGTEQLASATTKKKFGTIALTAALGS